MGFVLYAAALIVTPVLHGLSFPPTSVHWLAWIAFVPWFLAIRLARTRTALVLSAVITLAGTYLVARWLPRAVATYYAQPVLLGALLFVGAYLVTLAPWFLGFTAAYRGLARRSTSALPLLVAAAWVAGELGRVRFGDPFGLLGYSQTGVGPLMQIADVTGVYGVSFLLVAVNTALAEVGLAALQGRPKAGALGGVGVACAVVLAAVVYGILPRALAGDAAATRVAVVQANLDLGSQWRQEFYGRNLEEYMRLTAQLFRDGPPALVVWPEGSMTFFLEDEPLYRKSLAILLAPHETQLLAGGPRKTASDPPRYFNSAFVVSPEGGIIAHYDKQRLLPFAEYFPWGGIEWLRRDFGRVREFTPGDVAAALPTVAGPAGIVICNEVMFPELVAGRVRAGADLLVTLTNDSWLGDRQFSLQALDIARFRAVEQRRWLVRASTSGPSAIVDPEGRIVTETALDSRGTLVGTVAARDRVTPYGRVGDAFAVTCWVAVGTALIARRRA